MLRIGLSTCGKKVDEEFFKECKTAGIACVELSPRAEDFPTLDYAGIAEKAAAAGIEIWSLHLPFAPFSEIDIASTDEALRLSSVDYLSGIIAKGGSVGIRHFIIHPSTEPIEIEGRIASMAQARKSLKTLADAAEKAGGMLLVEDLPRTCLGRSSYDILELLKADDRLRVCFDTNHLLGEYIPDFIAKVGPYIESLHVSDYDAWNERHWLPGEGVIDWQELYGALMKAGYQGPWLYEIGYKPEWCILRERDLTAADFVRNATEIFEGRPITVLGKPVEPMTFWKA